MKPSSAKKYSTRISSLGPCKIQRSTSQVKAEDKKPVNLVMTSEELSDLGSEVVTLEFERAGCRNKIYFDPAKTRCGIVTCGGLCPGINAVIRSIVLTAHYHYGIHTIYGFKNGLRGFIPTHGYGVTNLTPDIVSNIHQFGGTILGTSRDRQNPEDIVDVLERMNMNVLFMIGGEGTMSAARSIVNEITTRGSKIGVIGIPKTVDNDINFIMHSFGFETAVEKAVETIQCAHIEATSVNNGVGLVKLMGRESGFIAAQATLASQEVNFVLIPEQPFQLEGDHGLLKALERRFEQCSHALIVVAEGAGQEHVTIKKSELYGNPELGDICGALIRKIKDHFKAKKIELYMKYIDPSYIVRSVPANAGDRVYCGFLGQYAVHAAMAGKTDMLVAKLKSCMVHLPLELVVGKRRKVNINSDYWNSVLETTGQKDYFD
jgi:6-phosphofructokinase 1